MTTIKIFVESEPHNVDLSSVILNRPAPNGGAFLLGERVPETVWGQMKPMAWYLNAEDLEDMDMFDAPSGWRYSLDALSVLIDNGYGLSVRGQNITSKAGLYAMFTEEAKQAYWESVRLAKEKQQAEDEEECAKAKAKEKQRREERTNWENELTQGLISTFAFGRGGVSSEEWHAAQKEWERIRYEGEWHGDDYWQKGNLHGETVYYQSYGNNAILYASQRVVDILCNNSWEWMVKTVYKSEQVAAIEVLRDSRERGVGCDVAKRLVEIHGEEFFTKTARRQEWWVLETRGDELEIAKKYNLCPVFFKRGKYISYEICQRFKKDNIPVETFWQHPNGTWYARGYDVSQKWPVELTEEVLRQL